MSVKKKAINIKIICATLIMLLLLNNLFMIPIVMSDENNTPPLIIHEDPLNGSARVTTSIIEISVYIEDAEGDMFNWSIETSPDIGRISTNNEENGTKICNVSNLEYDTTYYWYVNATDGENSTSEIYWFATGSEPKKALTMDISEYPINGTEANYHPRLEVIISGYLGDPLNVTFRTNASGSWESLSTIPGENGKYTQHTSGMDTEGKNYYWSVNITDGSEWENRTYFFEAQPFVLKWRSSSLGNTNVGPLAVDIDDDGIYEIFSTGEGWVNCLNGSTGEVRWREPYDEITSHSPFEIYDLNNDGIEEIVISCQQKRGGWTIAYHANDGTEYWRKQYESGEKYLSIADIEGNGYPYVYICSGDPASEPPENGRGRLRKLNGTTGEVIEEVFTWRPCWGGPSIADADNDGNFEVYLTDRSTSYNFPANKLAKGMQCYDAQTLELLWYDEDILCSSHGIALVDVNNDNILDAVAFNQVTNRQNPNIHSGIYIINGSTGKRMEDKCEPTPGLSCHSHFPIYDIDGDGHLEVITARDSPARVFDITDWTIEDTLDEFWEPPKMGNVIGDEKLEIIGADSYTFARSNVTIYNGTTYEFIDRINVVRVIGIPLVQDIDNDDQNELIVVDSGGRLYVYETSGYASTPSVRTNSQFYSERNLGAGVYVPLPGAPQPVLKEEYPANGSEYVEFNPTLSIHAVDFRYDKMDITISTNASDSWVNVDTFNNVGNGFYSYTPTNMNQINTKYYWRVTANDPDADNLTTMETYHFTTVANAPYVSNPSPADGAISVPINTNHLSCYLEDYPSGSMTYNIETVPDVGSDTGTVGNGIININLNSLSYYTTYKWYVNVSDGEHSTSKMFTFMTEPKSILLDQEFNDSSDNWYVSFGQSSLVTIDISNVGGNTGKKAKFTESTSNSVYLSQEFIQGQTDDFSISWDVYVDKVTDINNNPDRACWMFIGDDSDGINGPCSSDEDRFIYLAFVKEDGGSKGVMNLRALERYGVEEINGQDDFTEIASDLFLDTWYTIEVKVNFRLNRYSVYVNDELMRTIKPRAWKDELTHISFAQLSDGAGTFYIDNVFSPVSKRYRINTTAYPLTGGSIDFNPGESTYGSGAVVEINAIANSGWIFDHWEGDEVGNTTPITITMDKNKTINAIFVDVESPDISDIIAVKSSNSGDVNISCSVIDNELVNNVKIHVEYPDMSEENVTATSHDLILTYDDFENGWGNYSDGGGDCDISNDINYTYQGVYSAQIRDNSGSSSSFYFTNGMDVDMLGYQSLKIDFRFIAENMSYDEEEGDHHNFFISYYDGEIWHTIADYYAEDDFENDKFYHEIIYINETDYNFSSDMKISFRCDAYDNAQGVYIDKIYVNATKLSNYYYDKTYTQNGIYNYSIWAEDKSGNTITSDVNNFSLSLSNLTPIFSGASPTGSGIPISKNTLSVYIEDIDGHTFDWSIKTTPNIGNISKIGDSDGTKMCNISGLSYSTTYSWTVRAVDIDGWTNETYLFTTQSAPGGGGGDPGGGGPPPQPPKPTAKANGPYTGFVGEKIQFNASGSTAYDEIENYTWSFGDGKTGYGLNPTHLYNNSGTFTVKLTVKDNFGVTDEDETTAVIVTPNIIPDEPLVIGPQKGTKNTKYAYTASSIDGDNDTIQYNFDWDDGTSNTSDFIPSGDAAIYTHIWTAAGRYTIEVQAYDNQTPSDIARYIVLIDAMMIDDTTAYITDDDADGTYDTYHNGEIETLIEMRDGKYLIDTDGDGEYNNKFDSETGELTDYESETGATEEDYVAIALIVVIAVIIVVLIAFMFFIKKKKTPPKDEK